MCNKHENQFVESFVILCKSIFFIANYVKPQETFTGKKTKFAASSNRCTGASPSVKHTFLVIVPSAMKMGRSD